MRNPLATATRYVKHRFRELHPFEVQALVINACNLRCSYCRCPDIKTRLMTTEQWVDTIEQLGRLGTMRLKFQGGEPTLRNDFVELCAASRRAGIRTAVVTNGINVAQKPELLDELDEVVLSLDSVTPEIHDSQRGQGTHAQVLRAIDVVRERGLPAFVVMVVTRANLDQLDSMMDFAEARGVRLHAQPVTFGLHYSDDASRDIALSPEQVRAMHAKIVDWKNKGRPMMFSADTYANVARWPDYGVLTTPSQGDSKCMAGKFYVHIEANGDVWPCQQHGAVYTPKNIVRDGLEEALRNAQHHGCGDCFTAYLNERKAVFGLRPAAIYEMLRRD